MRRITDILNRMACDERAMIEQLPSDDASAAPRRWSYRQVYSASWALALQLREKLPTRQARVGLVADNSVEWVVADLALLWLQVTEVPVPLAFSAEQAATLLTRTDLCLVDRNGRERLESWRNDRPGAELAATTVLVDLTRLPSGLDAHSVGAMSRCNSDHAPGDWIAKIIHTSGTTATPKGVRIRAHGLDSLLGALHEVTPAGSYHRYLSLVPLSLLIEQVTALYLVILSGGTLVLLPSGQPLVGTSADATEQALPALRAARPTATVATPSLVAAFAAHAERTKAYDVRLCERLFGTNAWPLVSCGGAPVDLALLQGLEARGLVICEGYGLSENSSVVSWNLPGHYRLGTVGRPLPHVEVRIDEHGELLVRSSSLCAGYAGDADPSACGIDADGWLHTGDLAVQDDDGYLRITGRRKNVIITAHGRNISPEWVEAQYATVPGVRAVGVIGDGLSELRGLVVIDRDESLGRMRAVLSAFGAHRLSSIDQIRTAYTLREDDPRFRDYFTVTGRPRRDQIAADVEVGVLGGADTTLSLTGDHRA